MQILDPTNTVCAYSDIHQFSKLASFYLPQSAGSIQYGQHQRECKLIHYFYCLFFSYCIIAVKKIPQSITVFETSRDRILIPCLMLFWIFRSRLNSQWTSSFVAHFNSHLLLPKFRFNINKITVNAISYNTKSMKTCPRGSEPHSPVADDPALKNVAAQWMWAEQSQSCTLLMEAAHRPVHSLQSAAWVVPWDSLSSVPQDPASICFKKRHKALANNSIIRRQHSLWGGKPTISYIMIQGFF